MPHAPSYVHVCLLGAVGSSLADVRSEAPLELDGDGEHRSPDGRIIEWTFIHSSPTHHPIYFVDHLLKVRSRDLRRVWVRVRGDEGKPDLLLTRSTAGAFDFRDAPPTRYRFDELRVTVPEGTPMPRTWTRRGGQYVRFQGGSYQSHDGHLGWRFARQPDALVAIDPGPNPLSGKRAWGDWSALEALADVQPLDLRSYAREWRATRLEWRYQGRLVHAAVPADGQPDGYWHFCADGWDNCHDRDLRWQYEAALSRP